MLRKRVYIQVHHGYLLARCIPKVGVSQDTRLSCTALAHPRVLVSDLPELSNSIAEILREIGAVVLNFAPRTLIHALRSIEGGYPQTELYLLRVAYENAVQGQFGSCVLLLDDRERQPVSDEKLRRVLWL